MEKIANVLSDGGEERTAVMIHAILSINAAKSRDDFLVSNELWGGAGSIADESLISDPARRKILEALMVKLGSLQLANGKTNPRTEMWVKAFEQWASRS